MTAQSAGEMENQGDYRRWEERYSRLGRKRHLPDSLLLEHWSELPGPRVLDVACGEGRNSLFLAECGLRVCGIDRSPTALRKARQWAQESSLDCEFLLWDLDSLSLPDHGYDSIVVTRYWQPELCAVLQAALRPGGVLLYETYTKQYLNYRADCNPAHLLEPGELRSYFADMEILHSAEVDKPASSEYCAQLIARKK